DRVRALAPNGVDAAIDLHGTDTVRAALELGVPADRVATIAGGPTPPGGAIATGGGDATPGALDRIASGLAAGTLQLPIAASFPVEQIADAVALQRTGHVRGKVVVTV
ncbi:MAG TPA: zinc-binding dehydrogenase, partial [Microbacterium sp.]|uniref:zinc-binding dehydrogenase n=1 Tax=Microbacterium sp. TaxID=51671 RepID=UPI002B4AA9A0